MSDELVLNQQKPGIVILVAIFQFFWSALFFLMGIASALFIAFGAAWGVDDIVSQQLSRYSATPNFSYGLTLIFTVVFMVFFSMAIFFLLLGIGLLKQKKFAWYLQVAMSLLGLLSTPLALLWNPFVMPLGVVLNIVILVLFFGQNVRKHFKV